jgi:predicted glycosyltransferase involved in capsule biosynthesis
MFDLQGTTFCFHVRIDTCERLRNIKIVTDYYRKHCVNFQYIFFEDTTKPILLEHIKLHDNDKYIHMTNNGEWIKARGFNTGAKLSNNDIIIFHDTDIILHPEQLLLGRDRLIKSDKTGLIYPYDGLFIYTKLPVKDEFEITLDYNDLAKHLPNTRTVYFQNENVWIVHNNSVGGCVMARRDIFYKFKGYNPNFCGWGYEDDEIAKRVHILGYDVERINDRPMWHLPHDGEGASAKNNHEHYEKNRLLCGWVETQPRNILEDYIATWDI